MKRDKGSPSEKDRDDLERQVEALRSDICVFQTIVTGRFRAVTGHFKMIVTGDFKISVTDFGWDF